MPQFVSEGAEEIREKPEEGATAELVVRVDSASLETADEWVETHNGRVVESLDHGLLEIELPEVDVSALCDLTYVNSIERTDETIEVLDGGN